MFQRTKPCLFKETNGSYSNAVIGILIITISLSMGLSVLGVSANVFNGFQEDNFELPLIPENKYSEESSDDLSKGIKMSSNIPEDNFSEAYISGASDVSVPEKGVFGPFDTVPGTIEIFAQNLPEEPLPLKITDEYLDDYWVVVGTYGGYSWIDGYIKVMQAKSDETIWDNIVGYIEITATEILGPHGWTTYNLTFTVVGDHPIILDSNHPPVSPLGDFWVFGPDNLDKWVWFKVSTTWEGCRLPEQQFMVILAHKALSQNPKLPIFKTSPVES
ncbi:MAG: hypothetical protein ACXABG_06545 [Promethearchaeota archaeon]|jgi:hypothetical protein